MDLDPPRGTKRKAEELDEASTARRIKALDPDVVNKIAAGEIIVAPVHALKELVENAVDAGSTSLEVLVKEGGLKLLQITDNGCGIDKEDLPILCERFTTSKLQKFEDLNSIATYGFRGEALASISHIAHLTVTTKTKDSNCAWRAHYDGGKLAPAKPGQTPDPKPVAGRPGTQITVEDLFYNVPTRRRAFRSASDEYNKIIDMVGRYAVHCSHVAFSCKKHGESSASIAIQTNASVVDRIRQIYGGSVANELIEYSTADDRWGFKANGWATNANYNIKKTTFLLFINHRCVESSNIRKAIEQTYSAFLPKNGHPFVYLSLEIDPQRVDVNVHPTKREVNFLNEDEIIQAICEHIRSKLAAVDTSRTFMTQTLLPGGAWASPNGQQVLDAGGTATPHKAGTGTSVNPKRTPARPYENNLVRTDTNLRKITSMLPLAADPSASTSKGRAAPGLDSHASTSADQHADQPEYETIDRTPVACRLVSVRELRAAVREDAHNELTEVIANHTFVGIVDERRRLAAIQGGVKLFLVDYGRACYEYLYQVGLTDFGNFGVIRFSPPLDLRELLSIAAEAESGTPVAHETETGKGKGKAKEMAMPDAAPVFDAAEIVERVADQLIERREMLLEYFSFEISPAGELLSIPLLVKGYTPAIVKLPQFLLRLGPHVVWNEEKACFETFLKELASFYVPEQLPPTRGGGGGDENTEDLDDEVKARRRHVRWAVEHVFFPAFKARLVATNSLMKGGVLEIANLKGLYRVFERC
ncbi:DNA mismatch repair protein MutL [Coniochaeta sp. PMI_546]|nr:DNA mismatch repair protein MutL [Coniochaeta sp. PMI_546]